MQIFRISTPPLKYISVSVSSNIDLTPYIDACELLKKFIEFFVELNENMSSKRIMILETPALKLVENTTEFKFPEEFIDKTRMIANLLNVIEYAKKFESIELAIEFWKKYAKFDEEIVPLLYNAKSVIKLISSDVCYMINF